MQTNTNLAGNTNHVTDFLGHTWSFDCMGCAMSNGTIDLPGGIIYESPSFILATDPLIPIPGFLTITAKRHVNSFVDLTPAELQEVTNLLVTAERALKSLHLDDLSIRELTIVQEERSRHFHIWIFPTHDWMRQQFGPGVSYLRDISEYAQAHVTPETIAQTLAVAAQVRNFFQNSNH